MELTINNGTLEEVRLKKNEDSIVIPEEVNEISWGAFSSCVNLRSVTFLSRMHKVAYSDWYDGFRKCRKLDHIAAPNSKKYSFVDGVVYSGDMKTLVWVPKGKKEVVIPEGVITIAENSFKDCGKVTKVIIPDSVTQIGPRAFKYCTGLEQIVIPSSVKIIGNHSFELCTRLKEITLSFGVEQIGSQAFSACKKLAEVVIPDSVNEIKSRAFYKCSGLCRITLSKNINKIASWTFEDCNTLESIELPEAIESIEKGAFYNCRGLRRIILSENIDSISSRSFMGCKELEAIGFPGKLKTIGEKAFCGCSKLHSVIIPENVRTVSDWAFAGCKRLTGVKILSVNPIISWGRKSAFSGCVKIQEFNIGDTCQKYRSIDGVVYSKDSGSLIRVPYAKQEVSIAYGIKKIEKYAFFSCPMIRKVEIPDGTEIIGDGAFCKCTGLVSVEIPSSVRKMGDSVFYECCNLKEVIIPYGVKEIKSSMFKGCGRLSSVTVPDSVNEIGYEAFKGCKSLTKVNIPERVHSIERCAFSGCTSLTNITVPMKKPFELKASYFGNILPKGLISSIETICDHFDDDTYIKFVLSNWSRLSSGQQDTIADKLYEDERKFSSVGELLQKRSEKKLRVKDCVALAYYCMRFGEKLDEEYLISAYYKIKYNKNGSKALALIESEPILMTKIMGDRLGKEEYPAEKFVLNIKSERELIDLLDDAYAIHPNELPVLMDNEGRTLDNIVMAWLLVAHVEWERPSVSLRSEKKLGLDNKILEKPGISSDVVKLLKLIDKQSLQRCLLKIADDHLGYPGGGRKHGLASPICRLADEETMKELCRRAPKWKSRISGAEAPPFRMFVSGALLSDTFSAMLFIDRCGRLGDYADIRGMDEDTLRDKYLSDVGLDEQGGRAYDLGNQTVIARLQADLSFMFEGPDQKVTKSLPKRGADPVKYEEAKKDFAELKKKVKRITTNRCNKLFEMFLDGHTVNGDLWQETYLHNPVLGRLARLVVWKQGEKYFVLSDEGVVDSKEKQYKIEKAPIAVAHPMEMEKTEIEYWQDYFIKHNLKQPFAQIWERVHDPNSISRDRYEGSEIEIGGLQYLDRHGIHEINLYAFSEDYCFYLDDCELEYEGSTWKYYEATGGHYTLHGFSFEKYTRKVNHVVSVLDNILIEDLIKKDAVEAVTDMLEDFTLAQILDFIKTASENKAKNVTAVLLDYRNKHIPTENSLDSLLLDF